MRRIVVLTFAIALVAIGCSNKEESTVSGSPTPAATAAASPKVNNHGTMNFTKETFSVEVEQDNDGSDFYFKPTFISAPGNSTVTVELNNEGSVQHTFTMDNPKVDVTVDPDGKKTVTVKLGAETRYEFYCRFHGDQGMRGAFELH